MIDATIERTVGAVAGRTPEATVDTAAGLDATGGRGGRRRGPPR